MLLGIASVSYSQSDKTTQVDQFGMINCDDYLARMDNAINQAAKNSSSRIIVHVYEGNTPRYKYKGNTYTIGHFRPQYGLAKAVIRSMKKYLLLHKAPADRFVFKSAGFRENFTVDIWQVPNGAKEPEANPTLTKIKYRKGRPSGFCLSCCGP